MREGRALARPRRMREEGVSELLGESCATGKVLMRISGGFDAPLSEKIPELFVKIPDIFWKIPELFVKIPDIFLFPL